MKKLTFVNVLPFLHVRNIIHIFIYHKGGDLRLTDILVGSIDHMGHQSGFPIGLFLALLEWTYQTWQGGGPWELATPCAE